MSHTIPRRAADAIYAYRTHLQAFLDGAISDATFRDILVRVGICGQRQRNAYMVNVQSAAGAFSSDQSRIVAHLARTQGDGIVHLTTGQALQLHSIRLKDTADVLEDLLDAGLICDGSPTTNISTCPRAGVCPNEPFDATPFALALTEYLARERPNQNQASDFGIAFSGCSRDCGLCSVADLGFFATVKQGIPGFSVYAGGSVGVSSALAVLVEDFVPIKAIFPIADAVRRLLSRPADGGDRHKPTLRSMVEHLGADGFQSLCRREMRDTQLELVDSPQVMPPKGTDLVHFRVHQVGPDGPRFEQWRQWNTFPQHQEGFVAIDLPLPLGDITSRALHMITNLAEDYGDGAVHVTQNQDLQLRGIREEDLPDVFLKLRRIGRKLLAPPAVKFVSCAGASVCKFGLCQSRELAQAIDRELAGIRNRLGIPIHISGCPNACSRHPVASLGLYGDSIQFDGRLIPSYTIVAGGLAAEGRAGLASPVAKVPARAVPLLLGDFFAEAKREYQDGESLDAFMVRWGRSYLAMRSRRYALLPTYEEAPEVYHDFGVGAVGEGA